MVYSRLSCRLGITAISRPTMFLKTKNHYKLKIFCMMHNILLILCVGDPRKSAGDRRRGYRSIIASLEMTK